MFSKLHLYAKIPKLWVLKKQSILGWQGNRLSANIRRGTDNLQAFVLSETTWLHFIQFVLRVFLQAFVRQKLHVHNQTIHIPYKLKPSLQLVCRRQKGRKKKKYQQPNSLIYLELRSGSIWGRKGGVGKPVIQPQPHWENGVGKLFIQLHWKRWHLLHCLSFTIHPAIY